MRPLVFLISILFWVLGYSQSNKLTYRPSNKPIFLNGSGDTLSKAFLGGLNQPQFHTIDLNNDGKKDLFVHDRTGGVILPFINKGNNDITTFEYSPSYVSAFPNLKNTWVLFVDYDKDGKEDMWTSLNFGVVLFRNVTKSGDKMVKFERVSDFLRAYNFQDYPLDSSTISSDFYNRPTIADVDGDGDVDFFSYQAREGSLLLYRNMTKDFNLPLHPPIFDLADFCWGNFRDTSFDGIKLYACGYKIYRKHTGGSTLLWFDNDNDGDLDLLLGNADGKNLIYLKNGKKEFNLPVQDSIISYNGHWPVGTTPVNMNSFPAPYMLDADGDGVKDILVAPNQVENTSSVDQTQQVWFYKNTGTNSNPTFKFERKNYFTDKILDHGGYTAPVLQDMDGDGDLDLIIATNGDNAKTRDKKDRLILYRNIGGAKNPVFKLQDEDLWGISKDSLIYLSVTFGDLNADGKTDMVTGNYYGDLYFYKNIGSSTTWAFTTPIKNFGNIKVGTNSSPQLVDMDKNGLLDLVVGEKNGNFNYFRNTGSSTNPQFTLVDDTLGNFIVNEFDYNSNPPDFNSTGNANGIITDLDNDGKYDMVFGGEEGKVRFRRFNTINQTVYTEDSTILFDSAFMSFTTMDYGNKSRPAVGDVDGDGVKDIIVGNDRGGISFLKGFVQVDGILENRKGSLPAVYPNPTNGYSIKINKQSDEEFQFSLFDMNGKLIKTDVSPSGNITHHMVFAGLKDGIYILQSTSSNHITYFNKISVLGNK